MLVNVLRNALADQRVVVDEKTEHYVSYMLTLFARSLVDLVYHVATGVEAYGNLAHSLERSRRHARARRLLWRLCIEAAPVALRMH